MKTWGEEPVGLAVLLVQWPLPQALATPPVFGATAAPGDLPGLAATTMAGRALLPFGRFLRSKAAAYALAAACIALAAGLALHEGGARNIFFAESVGPAIRLVIDQPAAARQPAQHAVRSTSPRPSPVASRRPRRPGVQSAPLQAASGPAAAASAGGRSATDFSGRGEPRRPRMSGPAPSPLRRFVGGASHADVRGQAPPERLPVESTASGSAHGARSGRAQPELGAARGKHRGSARNTAGKRSRATRWAARRSAAARPHSTARQASAPAASHETPSKHGQESTTEDLGVDG